MMLRTLTLLLLFLIFVTFSIAYDAKLRGLSMRLSDLPVHARSHIRNVDLKTYKALRDMHVLVKNDVPLHDLSPSSTDSEDRLQKKRILPQGRDRIADRPNPDNLRILGGKHRGLHIQSPQVYLRPMMAKVRLSVFNSLTSLGIFAGGRPIRVLDVFAGSGSVGLEALSRGATHVTFVDSAKDCIECAMRNAARIGANSQCRSVCATAGEVLQRPQQFDLQEPYQLVSLTPPYEEVNYDELIAQLCESTLVAENSIVLLEYPVQMKTLPHRLGPTQKPMLGLRNRRFGRTVLATYVCNPTKHMDLRPEEFTAEFVRRRKKHAVGARD